MHNCQKIQIIKIKNIIFLQLKEDDKNTRAKINSFHVSRKSKIMQEAMADL